MAQAAMALMAGYSNVSITLQSCIFLLSLYQDLQEKIRNEIFNVIKENNSNSDELCPYEIVYRVIHEKRRTLFFNFLSQL